jgi:hypothetical protein
MGQFQPGTSGNAKGRPKKPASRDALRDSLKREVPEILEAVVTAAKAGDLAAAKLVLDRCMPALRPVDVPVPLALGDDTTDLAAASQAVLRGLAQGALSVDQAHGLAGVLGALVRVREVTELEARITRLEESANGSKS